jgi:chromate transport protein ChrA
MDWVTEYGTPGFMAVNLIASMIPGPLAGPLCTMAGALFGITFGTLVYVVQPTLCLLLHFGNLSVHVLAQPHSPTSDQRHVLSPAHANR